MMDLNDLLERVGYPVLIQMIIECWNEVILLILLSIIAIGLGSDKTDELRKRVIIPMTRELVSLYLAAFFYNLFDIVIHLNLGVSGEENLVVNLFIPLLYYFDSSNNYIRGRLFAVSYFATVISFLFMLAVLIVWRKRISRFIGGVMLTSTIIPLVAFIVNSTYEHLQARRRRAVCYRYRRQFRGS